MVQNLHDCARGIGLPGPFLDCYGSSQLQSPMGTQRDYVVEIGGWVRFSLVPTWPGNVVWIAAFHCHSCS